MKGYKAFYLNNDVLEDMFGNNVKCHSYIDGHLSIGTNGYHFCEDVEDCFLYFCPTDDVVVYEIETIGLIEQDFKLYEYPHNIYVCSFFKLIKKIEYSDIMLNLKNDYIKYKFARYDNQTHLIEEIKDSFAAFKCGVDVEYNQKLLPLLKGNDITNWLKYYPLDYGYFHTNAKTSLDALALAINFSEAKCLYDLIDNVEDAVQWTINVDKEYYNIFDKKFIGFRDKLKFEIDLLSEFNLIDNELYDNIVKILG